MARFYWSKTCRTHTHSPPIFTTISIKKRNQKLNQTQPVPMKTVPCCGQKNSVESKRFRQQKKLKYFFNDVDADTVFSSSSNNKHKTIPINRRKNYFFNGRCESTKYTRSLARSLAHTQLFNDLFALWVWQFASKYMFVVIKVFAHKCAQIKLYFTCGSQALSTCVWITVILL